MELNEIINETNNGLKFISELLIKNAYNEFLFYQNLKKAEDNYNKIINFFKNRKNEIDEKIMKDISLKLESVELLHENLIKDINEIKGDNELNIPDFKDDLNTIILGLINQLEIIKNTPLGIKPKITFEDMDKNKIEIKIYINSKKLPQDNNTYKQEEKEGIVSSCFITLITQIRSYIQNNNIEKMGNSIFTLAHNKPIHKYKNARLNGADGQRQTRLIFYLEKENNTINIYICDYINQDEHNASLGKSKGCNEKYKRLTEGKITISDYPKSKAFKENNSILMQLVK